MLKGVSVECMEYPNEDTQKSKRGQFLYIRGRDIQIATCTQLLNIKYKFCEFNGDLTETIN